MGDSVYVPIDEKLLIIAEVLGVDVVDAVERHVARVKGTLDDRR